MTWREHQSVVANIIIIIVCEFSTAMTPYVVGSARVHIIIIFVSRRRRSLKLSRLIWMTTYRTPFLLLLRTLRVQCFTNYGLRFYQQHQPHKPTARLNTMQWSFARNNCGVGRVFCGRGRSGRDMHSTWIPIVIALGVLTSRLGVCVCTNWTHLVVVSVVVSLCQIIIILQLMNVLGSI